MSSIAARSSRLSDEPPRLAVIDGLRGLTALFVVLHHAWFEVFWAGGAERWNRLLLASTKWLMLGRHGVNVFIVLSGFCLAMPLVKDHGRGFDLTEFFKRRARRILPTYYAAMAMSLLLIAMIPLLQDRSQDRWDHALPAWTPQAIWSHLLLLHNLLPTTNCAINPPFWSVASEWQIYFIFALILVPICQRAGAWMMTAAGLLLGLAIVWLIPEVRIASPWFIGSFSLGVLAAFVAYSADENMARLRDHLPWRVMSIVSVSVYLLSVGLFADFLAFSRPDTELLMAFGVAIFLVDLAIARKPMPVIKSLLESPQAVQLGSFSYSLYLMHFPLLAIAHLWLRQMQVEPTLRLLLMLFAASPVTVLACWAFYLRFEKPFLARRSKVPDQVVRLAPILT